MDIASRIGENLARYRKRAELSQEELAALSSLHRTEVGLVERGQRVPGADTLLKLAGALAISVEELTEGIAWQASPTREGRFQIVPESPESK